MNEETRDVPWRVIATVLLFAPLALWVRFRWWWEKRREDRTPHWLRGGGLNWQRASGGLKRTRTLMFGHAIWFCRW
jgi:hypothetical protein